MTVLVTFELARDHNRAHQNILLLLPLISSIMKCSSFAAPVPHRLHWSLLEAFSYSNCLESTPSPVCDLPETETINSRPNSSKMLWYPSNVLVLAAVLAQKSTTKPLTFDTNVTTLIYNEKIPNREKFSVFKLLLIIGPNEL